MKNVFYVMVSAFMLSLIINMFNQNNTHQQMMMVPKGETAILCTPSECLAVRG